MATNRVRTMSTTELVQRVVVGLVDAKQAGGSSERDARAFSRLCRELQKRTATIDTHPEACVCEDCCDEFDYPFD